MHKKLHVKSSTYTNYVILALLDATLLTGGTKKHERRLFGLSGNYSKNSMTITLFGNKHTPTLATSADRLLDKAKRNLSSIS